MKRILIAGALSILTVGGAHAFDLNQIVREVAPIVQGKPRTNNALRGTWTSPQLRTLCGGPGTPACYARDKPAMEAEIKANKARKKKRAQWCKTHRTEEGCR